MYFLILSFIALLVLVSVIIITLYIYNNPTVALIPYNLLIDMITEKKVFYTEKEKREIFPLSQVFERNWTRIQTEALECFNFNHIKGNVGKEYIQERDGFWEGWNTFPLRMFGQDIKTNMEMCPTLSKIIRGCGDQVPTAFLSVMEPGKYLDPHYGPFKGILRYHLGLVVPKGECYISVDGIKYKWKEGEGVLFDETYLHYVHNNTSCHRIILFLDIKRPFGSGISNTIMNYLNNFILWTMKISPHNRKVIKRYSDQLLNTLSESLNNYGGEYGNSGCIDLSSNISNSVWD